MKSFCIWLALSVLAFSDVTFVFDYSGSTEFNDPSLGAARRAALESVGAEVGALLDHTATIQMKVTSSNVANDDTLASAGSEPVAETDLPDSGYVQEIVMAKILTGNDLNGSAVDGEVDVNFGQIWDYDDVVSAGAFDFKSTVYHELLHALGFSSGIAHNGEDEWESGVGEPGIWSVFDDFVTDANGAELVDDTDHILDRTRWLALRTAGVNGLFFNGPNARAANGGNPVGLYTPSTFEEGSSYSHLDDENPALAGLMMLSATDTGPSARTLTGIERGILMDLGYSLKAAASTLAIVNSTLVPGGLALDLTGPAGQLLRVESSSVLDTPVWTTVQTIVLTGAPISITVPSSNLNGPQRIYRGVLMPLFERPAGAGAKRR